jgi:SAM-dependent methyltransferase
MTDRQQQWNESYQRRENFVFAPHEEVVRFISKYVRKRIGLREFQDVLNLPRAAWLLDLGCGIGRHLVFAHEMGLEAYGIDLSDSAVSVARTWGAEVGMPQAGERIRIGSATQLPWPDGFFDVVISHGVLDSVPFDVARAAVVDCARVLPSGGLFYCDLISGDDSLHGREFAEEEIVATTHERDTVQSYFNFAKLQRLIEGVFQIVEATLVRRENLLEHASTARTHLVLKK